MSLPLYLFNSMVISINPKEGGCLSMKLDRETCVERFNVQARPGLRLVEPTPRRARSEIIGFAWILLSATPKLVIPI